MFSVWFLVSSVWWLVFGVWCFMFCVLCLVFGVWCLMFGVWCLFFFLVCFGLQGAGCGVESLGGAPGASAWQPPGRRRTALRRCSPAVNIIADLQNDFIASSILTKYWG